ncbi:hypothetical protein GW17_00015865 [Ensete ventricosum]|uniref:Uncharacterized protein n=1 Tax=Ensete ventricosum TaxID=4639 RepID=A0A427A6K8_ENSVE|nr:hypothetical protein B296_00031095 [Ensete ventricosum]RWW20044.1 hypothetical protein GW17_00015865 [Ensete ventricosum]RZR94279.1 hypothetical protein BHM03_00022958 [Ensete ventricosum]
MEALGKELNHLLARSVYQKNAWFSMLHVLHHRGYFKCREKLCKAKKRVEWPPSDPSSVKVTYDGVHDHPSPQLLSASYQEAPAGMANRYNLVIQVLGLPGDSS